MHLARPAPPQKWEKRKKNIHLYIVPATLCFKSQLIDTYSRIHFRHVGRTYYAGSCLFFTPFSASGTRTLYTITSMAVPRPSMTLARITKSPAVSRVRSSSVNHISMSGPTTPRLRFWPYGFSSRPGADGYE